MNGNLALAKLGSVFLLGALLAGSAACQSPAGGPAAGGGAAQEAPPVTGPTSPDKVKRGGVLRGTWTGTLAHLDMHQVGVLGTWNAGNLMYNGLIEWDAFDKSQQKIIPALAKSWEASPDGTTFTFKLQEGVQFHDGTAVTAEDVVYSLNRIFDPPKGVTSARKEQFSMVDRVQSPDPGTVVVTTKFPSANFLALLADGWHVIVPKHVLDKDPAALKQSGVGTGPFVFKEFVPDQRVVLTRNPNYFRSGLPYLDGVELYRFKEETTLIAALTTNQLDMLNPAGQGISSTGGKDIKSRAPNLVVESNPRLAIDLWRYNVTRPPLDKVGVRQALTLAVDKAEYMKFLNDNDGTIGTLVFPGSQWDLPKAEQEKLIGYEPNMEDRLKRAKQLLADNGLAGGFTIGVTGPVGGTGNAFEDFAQGLEAAWGKIGVKVKREPLQQEEARQREAESLFDVYVGGYGIATIDPVGVVGDHFLCASGRNTSKLCDQELEQLYEKQLKLLDVQQRTAAVHDMVRRAVNLSAMNIIDWNNEYHVRWPYVRDWIVTPSRYTDASKLEYVWFDK